MTTSTPSLIVRLPNWVGDVVMALPTLQAMKHAGIKLHLLGKPWAKDLLVAVDMPISTLSNQLSQSIKKLAALKESRHVLLLTNSFSSALMARLAGKAPIGYKTDGRRWLLSAGLAYTNTQHEVEYFWNIARFACQYWFPELKWPEQIPTKIALPLHPSAIQKAKQALNHANINQPYWVLCPFANGSGQGGESKIWPHWQALSAQLTQYPLVVCPGKSEEALCRERVPNATVLSGLNLGEYAAILAGAKGVIANDSGPMHIAAAVGANTLGIFGTTDPQRTCPWGGQYIGMQSEWPTVSQVLNRLKQLQY